MSRPVSTPVPATAVRPVRPTGAPRRAARAAAVAGALVASCALATSAHAADGAVRTIVEPLAAQAGPDRLADPNTLAATAAGNGHVAWVVVRGVTFGAPADAQAPVAEVWTPRDGQAAKVAEFPVQASGLRDVELGEDAAGDPVLVVASAAAAGGTEFRLVALNTGQVRKVASVRRGLQVGAMAIDAGRLCSVVHPARVGPRNTSSLWRAPLAGTSVGRATKVRTSARGETWFGVDADVHRIAVTSRAPEKGDPSSIFAREELAFGTLRGPWTRTGLTHPSEGGSRPVTVLGFSRDRKAVITAQDQQRGAPLALRVPMGKGKVQRLRLGDAAQAALQSPSYDAAIERILAFGPDEAGQPSVGWTGIVLR
ncbi:hypothetical protein [Patulibacter americanus]|uniref:hypothetical protein n=1 Tax=Patulibacter americanus TaxID=588672 RepID=UPI0003B353F9|nr:hypothetical protein [Patulibacter americanus]